MAGDYILSVASTMLARIRNDDVTLVLSQVSDVTVTSVGWTVLCTYIVIGIPALHSKWIVQSYQFMALAELSNDLFRTTPLCC